MGLSRFVRAFIQERPFMKTFVSVFLFLLTLPALSMELQELRQRKSDITTSIPTNVSSCTSSYRITGAPLLTAAVFATNIATAAAGRYETADMCYESENSSLAYIIGMIACGCCPGIVIAWGLRKNNIPLPSGD